MRFLVCALDTEGVLFPLIGLAKKLTARGHDVAFASDSVTAATLAAQGQRRIPCDGAAVAPWDEPVGGTAPPLGRCSFHTKLWWQPAAVAGQVRHIEGALATFAADALVGSSLTLGPLIAGELRRLPVALLGFCAYLWPSYGVESPAPRQARLVWRLGDMLQTLDRARALFALPAARRDLEDCTLLGDLFLLRSVAQLEEGWQSLPSRVHLVGSCLWEPEAEAGEPELARWLLEAKEGGWPVLYVQHGRTFRESNFWQQLKEALADQPYRVAVSADRLDCDVGTVPHNFLVRPHLPQEQVLRAASGVIASANTTVVLGALQAGLPSVLIPVGGEQPDVAERCAARGVAQVLDSGTLTSAALRGAIVELLADGAGYRARAARLAAAFARIDSFGLAADLLERLGMSRAPVWRESTSYFPRKS